MGLMQGLFSFEIVVSVILVVIMVGVSVLKNYSDRKLKEVMES